jgi:phage-related protein
MGKKRHDRAEKQTRGKPIAWLHGEIKTPPFTTEGRREAGELLRFLQQGEVLSMPHAEPLSIVGPNCGALRIRDGGHNWRIVYRIDADAIVVVDVYAKKTQKIPQKVISNCRRRLMSYDETARLAAIPLTEQESKDKSQKHRK